MLQSSRPHGLLTPPRTPAMLAIALFVTVGLMFSPLRYDKYYTVPYTIYNKLLSGKTFTVGIEKDHSWENVCGSSIS